MIVLNTCVVRQSAEDKAYGRLQLAAPAQRTQRPDLVINLMGCLVGVKGHDTLQAALPLRGCLLAALRPRPAGGLPDPGREPRRWSKPRPRSASPLMDGDLHPAACDERGSLVPAHVPVVLGCSHACTFCIIPYRRGVERSRPVGRDPGRGALPGRARASRRSPCWGRSSTATARTSPTGPTWPGCCASLHEVDGLERIRFLTSHPNWMTDELLDAVAELPKVMPHIEVPVQAGDDEVLANMHRGYTADDYRRLVETHPRAHPRRVRSPPISSSASPARPRPSSSTPTTCWPSCKLDVAHLARYSPRPGTVAERRMPDDVPEDEKMRRFRLLEELQEGIAGEINARYLGETVEVLFEEKVQRPLEGAHPHQQAGLRRSGRRPARAGAPVHDHLDRTLVDAGLPAAPGAGKSCRWISFPCGLRPESFTRPCGKAVKTEDGARGNTVLISDGTRTRPISSLA